MKTIRRFALVLLSIAMLFTLTSCGGSNASAESQLTSKINEKLSGTEIQVSYDSKLNEKLVVYIDVYRNSGDETAAIKAAGLDPQYYAAYASTSNSTINDAAAIIAGQISAEKNTTGRVAKKIGYASAQLVNGGNVIFALVQFS